MSDDFDDLPRGNGSERPSKEQTLAVYNYLRSRNRKHSTMDVVRELAALGFKISKAPAGRHLVGAEGRVAARPDQRSPIAEAQKRRTRAKQNNRHEHKKAKEPKESPIKSLGDVAAKLLDGLDTDKIANKVMAMLAGDGKKSSTELAIEENRVRMALNIALGERMIEKSEFLLLDMRGTAAMVDAFTVASKLSGGASIDIVAPAAAPPTGANGTSPGGHPMKELNPPRTGMAADIAQFMRERAADRAQRA